MSTALRLCVVDDHALLREGIRALFSFHPDITVVAEAEDARTACDAVNAHRPDVLLLDVSLPGTNGIAVAREVLRLVPETRILFLSMHHSDDFVADALAAGAHGYVSKRDAASVLVEAVRTVAKGESFFSPLISRAGVENLLRLKQERGSLGGPLDVLSGREREVFHLLVQGYSNDAVAANLLISRRTVETHRAHLLKKLQLHSAADLFRFASRHELLSL